MSKFKFHVRFSPCDFRVIDLFKVNAAILPGMQNYWGERAAKHIMQMAD